MAQITGSVLKAIQVVQRVDALETMVYKRISCIPAQMQLSSHLLERHCSMGVSLQ